MFWIIVVLVGALLIPNALYAFREFLATKRRAWLFAYSSLLCLLGYFLFHLSFRAIDFIQTAKETMAVKNVE